MNHLLLGPAGTSPLYDGRGTGGGLGKERYDVAGGLSYTSWYQAPEVMIPCT